MQADDPSPYRIVGPDLPVSPVVLSVPHAGRAYPAELRAALNVPPATLLPLEDRLVDMLALAARGDESAIVATRPRAWIDLNRAEWERDPQVEADASRQSLPRTSAKLRAGLGLVPRRSSGVDHIWNRRFTRAEIDERIAHDHRPYHAALAALLRAARSRFGIAILLDIHSMPRLAGAAPPSVVLGDRFGKSASDRFVAAAQGAVIRSGMTAEINTPYAGGHILDTHGAPERDIHAIQIEIDRSRYLDADGAELGAGATRTIAMLRRIVTSVCDEAIPGSAAAE